MPSLMSRMGLQRHLRTQRLILAGSEDAKFGLYCRCQSAHSPLSCPHFEAKQPKYHIGCDVDGATYLHDLMQISDSVHLCLKN